MSEEVVCLPVRGIGEVRPGDDLADLLAAAAGLRDGDVLVVTSKVVSKAEGQVRTGSRAELLAGQTDRVVARRGPTTIVRTHHGLVMAGGGIDASNTTPGTAVLLPVDPDGSARALRERLARDGGPNVAVVVTDTSGRAWRNGQTDIAIGVAGLDALHDYAGRVDGYGNPLVVTAPAVADEIAGAADLVKGKLDRRPAAVVRGLAELVLPRGSHGAGAGVLVRDERHDMFGLGAREAVCQAVRGVTDRGFGTAAAGGAVREAMRELGVTPVLSADGDRIDVPLAAGDSPADQRRAGALQARLEALAVAHGWTATDRTGTTDTDISLRFSPVTP